MDVFLGTILPFGFSFAPRGWSTCEGQSLSVSQNTALFSLLGVYYGGNGQTSFNLPDLRGRAIFHTGQRPGGASYQLGQNGGNENATLVTNNLPPHTHSLNALNGNGTSSAAQNNVLATGTGSTDSGEGVAVAVYAPAGSGMVAMAGQSIGPTGSSTPFSTLTPYLAVTVCIALQGIFPSRN